MTEQPLSITAEALQTELLMDMCEKIDDQLVHQLEQLGQAGRSEEVLAMEVRASRARVENVAQLMPLIELYSRLITDGMFRAMLKHPSFSGHSKEEQQQLIAEYGNVLFATNISILANLVDKQIVRFVPQEERR
ncbi:hypothetical protein [Streptomyces sp. WZ-12]|uniref:hypothetical protein n=1 Tax=Streptomyces sp. WZ-12 TaxID=3030210 RepID=UPI0023813D46|nr:hypothetical protein [Streptomyces sp. WZ-12]